MFNKSPFILKRVFVPLLLLVCLSSCKEEVKPLEFETIFVEDNFQTEIEVAFDMAKENSDVAKNINKEIKKAILKNIPISENSKIETIDEALKDFETQFLNFKNDFEDSEQTWYLSVETELIYKSENIITMGLSTYSDTGGAHGNGTIQFLNFNPETGKILPQTEFISNMDGFKKLAESFFLDHMKNEGTDVSEFFFGKPFQLPENIGFNDEGVILLYNTYEIASYNQDYIEFVIPMETAQDFLSF
ncbi:DUF3298 domain-containing protein [Winogradskyella litorisediminis]|uniref:DUF3298 domain-containing protein n=1 Tax=Winogradskyella litorisediminis TaxID=1156618 RepID=A0ABW3N503_9FLAO